MMAPHVDDRKGRSTMKKSRIADESGIALVTALLVLMVASAIMAGMIAALLADQRSHATDRDQSVAYAAAHAGLEKLTSNLAGLFNTDFSPSAGQIATLATTPPAITGFQYTSPGGAAGSGYQITFTPDPGPGANTGNPLAFPNTDITTGPFEGFKGLVTPYTITVTAKSATGNSEVRLRRELQTVAVPVFQFGIFGEKSLGFHAGPAFDFGGRVHTNQTLYLAAGTNNSLIFRDKITAFTEVVRNRLSNGRSITLTNHTGTVTIPRVIGGAFPADYRQLADTEGSGTTAVPWGGWKNLSEVDYHTNIRTETTGAKVLNLPLVSNGARPIDLMKRPTVMSNESVTNPFVYGQRYFAQASLRILLSDRASDLTGLPTIDNAVAPLQFDGGLAGYAVGAGRPPVALSPGPEPFVDPANGNSLTWVSGIGGGGATLTISYRIAPAPSPVVNAVPTWMNWGATTTRVGVAAPFVCTTVTPTQLLNCGNHPLYPVGTVITFTPPVGPTYTATVNPASALNNATINLTGFTTAQRWVATRTFFVGEDSVTCTGFTTTTLTGCTYPGGAIAVNEPIYTGATTPVNTPLLHGFIKIEKQNAAGVWSDVTLELLNLGFADRNQSGDTCADPTPNAVIRMQRLRDNGLTAGQCAVAANNYSGSLVATDFIPNNIFDAREGNSRFLPILPAAGGPSGMNTGGLFSYVALDVNNFRRWVTGAIPGTGTQALNNNGYIVYFSDRRGDHKAPGDAPWPGEVLANNPETGEFGFEDSINPANAAWAQNGVLEAGEDFNENNILDRYGETPHPLAVPVAPFVPIANMGFDAASRPWTAVPLLYSGRGRLARPVLFRRALKIINGGIAGGINNVPAAGFTVASENPVYVQGNFNATTADVTAEPNAATALMADSITLLSNAFEDVNTFIFPNDAANRVASDTGYRFAMLTGKTVPFPKPAAWGVEEMGSDGGVHNFMKMLENWAGFNLRYRGSMVSLFFSRQAVGIYRADGNIYGAPTRGYNFDTDFLTPTLLPPGTPMFRDINTLKFRQILRPNQ
jgi:hypothetical protein